MQISSNYNVSFGHIYSQALDSVLKNSEKMTRKQETQLNEAVKKASGFQKSVITSSTSKGLVLLTSDKNGNRVLEKTYPMTYITNTNIEQLKDVVKDAERLEKSDLADINPVKIAGRPESVGFNYQYIYDKTINGYSAKF